MVSLILLPDDILLKIIENISYEDILHLHYLNTDFNKKVQSEDFLARLSIYLTKHGCSNFEEMCKQYHKDHVTYHSRKYYSLNECFVQSALTNNLDMAKYYASLGGDDYHNFLLATCESNDVPCLQWYESQQDIRAYESDQLLNQLVTAMVDGESFDVINYLCEIFSDLWLKILEDAVKRNQLNVAKKASKTLPDNSYVLEDAADIAIEYNSSDVFEFLISIIPLDTIDFLATETAMSFFLNSCIQFGSLEIFQKLCIYLDHSKNITDRHVMYMSSHARLDLVKYLNENNLYKFDQFQWDMLMLCAFCLDDEQVILSAQHSDKCDLISYAIDNGGKLYKAGCSFFLSAKRHDLIEKIFTLPDIFTHETSRDYLLSLFSANRHYNMFPTNFIDETQHCNISQLSAAFCGGITPDDLLVCACQTGNTDHLSRALTLGANAYQKGIHVAKTNGYDYIVEVLITTWNPETGKEIQSADDTITNYDNSWVESCPYNKFLFSDNFKRDFVALLESWSQQHRVEVNSS
jgi:hypothetical protein